MEQRTAIHKSAEENHLQTPQLFGRRWKKGNLGKHALISFLAHGSQQAYLTQEHLQSYLSAAGACAC